MTAIEFRWGPQSWSLSVLKGEKAMEKPRKIGPYVVLREIGKGGMATVYEARLLSGDGHVALKVARSDQSDFLKEEAENLATLVTILGHPNILKILPLPLGKGEKDYYIARDPKTNNWYIALEYIDGGSLRDKLNQEKRIELREAIEIISQVGSALDYAHSKGIIHRDIKPTNILFQRLPSGETRVLLSDFGIAGARVLEGVKGIIGTPCYMSPEQASGKDVNHRSDIYSLGVVLYEMLTGGVPFEGTMPDVMHQHIYQPPPPPSGISPYIPREVETVIMKALAKNPEDRFQSVKEMVAALQEAIQAKSSR
jgi:serine/threonine protein kinase